MYRIIFTIVAVLLFVAPSQAVKVEQGGKILTEHAVQMGGKRSPLKPNAPVQTSAGTFYGVSFVTETPACASPFANFPATFEGTGTCTSQETAVTSSSNTDCDYTTSPIVDTQSAKVSGGTPGLATLSGNSVYPAQSGNLQLAWYHRIDQAATTNTEFFAPATGGASNQAKLYTQPSGKLLLIGPGFCALDFDADGTALTVGTNYKVCYRADLPNSNHTVYVDPVDGEWCAGAHTVLATTCGTPVTGNNGYIFQSNNSYHYVIDDLTACTY
jgi:hypothetical protein